MDNSACIQTCSNVMCCTSICMKFSGLIYVLRFIYPNLEPVLMSDNTWSIASVLPSDYFHKMRQSSLQSFNSGWADWLEQNFITLSTGCNYVFTYCTLQRLENVKATWADSVLEAPTWVGSREGINRDKPFPHKICREAASNPRPGDSVRQLSPLHQA